MSQLTNSGFDTSYSSSSAPQGQHGNVVYPNMNPSDTGYSSACISLNPNAPIIQPTTHFTQPVNAFKGIPGCLKCNGTGFKVSKKKDGKQKPCKLCVQSSGFCPKCNNTGLKIKNGKPCKCKEKKDKKKDKKDKQNK